MVQIRPPLPPPNTTRHISKIIQFRHPAYPDDIPELLGLNAVEGEDRDGVDYDTALLSCCIITGNKWREGFIARKDDQGAFRRVNRPYDGILRAPVYYFCLEKMELSEKYPVVPSFDHWRFPHGDIPLPWSEISIPTGARRQLLGPRMAAMSRDGSCCKVTGCAKGIEVVHVVPVDAGHWFNSNDMKRYCQRKSIDNENNLITLRRDIRHLFNHGELTFVAKKPDNARCSQVVTHILCEDGPRRELANLYHNRMLHDLRGVAVEMLFARFAWAVFRGLNHRLFDSLFCVQVFDPKTKRSTTERLSAAQIRARMCLFEAYRGSDLGSPRGRGFSPVTHNGFDSDSEY
ncbi:hypothetical protein QBC46DRAFT_91925 [Diplogelasinospora grovesii]|uniref:HNH nuclease domain-containing protein n=1 Tax=Diplogelasinospora grovesii TaxID=303347 RepID=A0AAN6N9N3_9PEZI|nr:hypothetical protein QBC46DRAFT_91925 [Diplogelasinospora grovesii]